MEKSIEGRKQFPKLVLESTPLSRNSPGSSSLSLSLSGTGSRTGTLAPPKLSTDSPNAFAPTSTPPISVRQSHQLRVADVFSQQCSNSPELSSSGRYLQSSFTLSPLERASRAESASLFEKFQANNKSDVPRTVPTPLQQQLPRTSQNSNQSTERGAAPRKTTPVRSNTESEKFNYDFSTGQLRRGASNEKDVGIERSNSRNIQTQFDSDPPSFRAVEPTSVIHGQARRFLSPSPFERIIEDQDRASSLTSDSTVGSPLSDVLATPTDSEYSGTYGPPISGCNRSKSFHDPTSLKSPSEWTLDEVHRNRSCGFEIAPPVAGRRKRRAFSEKRASPANQFLSGWATHKTPEPDDEGQEVGAYVLGKQVGYGGFSVVKEVFTIKNGVKITRAVKIVRKKAHALDHENEKIQAEFDHEVSIWRYLSHPHILPLLEVYDTPFATYCFTRLTTSGTLFDLVKANRQGLSAYTAQKYSYQLASALRYLHEDVRILHRDIKLENCLIDVSNDEEGSLLLCDFGMAEQMPGSNDDDSDSDSSSYSGGRRPHKLHGPSDTSTSIKGSLSYASPEMMISPCPQISAATDMWAFGVVLYALHTGSLPFNHTFQPKLQMMIAKGDWGVESFKSSKTFQENPALGKLTLEVVQGCLCKQIDKRWTIGQVLESEWLEDIAIETL
ncbi:kinase-like domain-containing protein [Peziza echinospora]|nr:kinase-like domain-containing protein [Peziza echinospora]